MTLAASQSFPKEETLPRWDLSDFYPSPDSKDVNTDIEWSQKTAREFKARYQGKLKSGGADFLAESIRDYEALSERMGKLMSYAQLVYAANMAGEEESRFYQNVQEQMNDVGTDILFYSLEINELDDETLERWLLESTALAHYAPWIRDMRVFRPYQLSESLETLLHEKQVTGAAAWMRLFDETLAGLVFTVNGKEMSSEEALHLLSEPDGELRKAAAEAISETLGKNIRTFTFVTNTLAKDKAVEDKWRKFPRPITSRNVSNFVEDAVVDALIGAVKGRYKDLSHRYYRMKASWLHGKDSMPYWDRNAPLPGQDNSHIPWPEAVALVLESYGEFSGELRELGQKFFDNDWIDVPPRAGKSPGAFAHPTVPSVHPYLLLNYQGKLRDVMTLAHELGHGVHQLLSADQGQLMCDTPLTLAETASVFGEQLTFRKLLAKQKDAAQRRHMVASKVEDMLNTVVRQVAFCEFERKVHDARREGEIPTQQLNQFWLEVQREALGPAIEMDESYGVYWSYIPHFIHSPFYVYAYAFGDCLVNALYAHYQEQPEGFETKYFDMLRAGGTLHHKELLAPFGMDASDPAFWNKGLDIIAGFIDELE